MAYATGLRLLAALCFFASLSIILAPVTIPLGVFFWWKAKKKENEKERREQKREQFHEEYTS